MVQVKAIKASLARKKVSDERVCKQIEDSWVERIKKRRSDHKIAVARQDDFIEKLNADCKMIKDRKEGLDEVLHFKREAREPSVETAKREIQQALKAERENWLQAEKVSEQDETTLSQSSIMQVLANNGTNLILFFPRF